jgi:molybdopterin converting factor subunit 1
VRVLYFGILKDVLGLEREEVELADGSSITVLLDSIQQRGQTRPGLWESIAIAVNQEYVRADIMLHESDEVALLPPVSGGLGETARMHVAITNEVIDAPAIIAAIKAGPDGAVCTFDGIVRNNTRGRETLFLEYEAYEEMALQQMRGLATEALTKFSVRDVALVHRLGRLHVGESSVLVVVASAHRGAAFDACRWLIDTLKKTVPIWKKEHFVDGAVWADGESFPEDIVPTTVAKK